MLLHKLNSFCNNCLNLTSVDPRLQTRNLHPHVFAVCRDIGMYPTKMYIENDTVKVSLVNKANLTIIPDKECLELMIPKDNIAEWSELLTNLHNQDKFSSKEILHGIVSQYDNRDLRFYSATIKDDIEVGLHDYNGTKHNKIDKMLITKDGLLLQYKYSINYNLYKAFNMNIYK
jgi:hypothetical protein